MTDDMTERIKAYRGVSKLKLGDEEFIVRSIRPKDMALIMESAGDETIGNLKDKKEGDFKAEDMGKFLEALSTVGIEMLMRSYPNFTKDEAEDIVSDNFQAFSQCIMGQIQRYSTSDDTRKQAKLRHAVQQAESSGSK
jgi:hypothetical protein